VRNNYVADNAGLSLLI